MSNDIIDIEAAQAIVNQTPEPGRLSTNREPVNWRTMKDRFDPDGDKVKAQELVDRTFNVTYLKPFDSSFDESKECYWVKGVDVETGQLFNTVLGGTVVCEILNGFYELNRQYHEALANGDDATAEALAEMGAGAPIQLTLIRKEGGKYGSYYDFE